MGYPGVQKVWEFALPGVCLVAQLDLLGGVLTGKNVLMENYGNVVFLKPDKGKEAVPYQHAKPCPILLGSESNIEELVIAASTLVTDKNGSVLLTQRNSEMRSFPNTWVPPGGTLTLKESLKDAAKRELDEETGITGGEFKLVCVWESAYPPFPWGPPVNRHHFVAYYTTSMSELKPKIRPNWESEDWMWLSKENCQLLIQKEGELKETIQTENLDQKITLKELLPDPKRRKGMTQGTYFALNCLVIPPDTEETHP